MSETFEIKDIEEKVVLVGISEQDGDDANDSLLELADLVKTAGAKVVSLAAENPEMITQSIKDMPLRSFSGFTGGLVSQESVDGLVDMCNRKKGGVRKFIKGFKRS